MNDTSTQARNSDSHSTGEKPSYGHLLLVWVFLGVSLMGLGSDLYQAMSVAFPLSSLNAGLLFGTSVVISVWVAGFRPSLGASAVYFSTQLIVHLLMTVMLALAVPGSTSGPWMDVILRGLSIIFATVLAFHTIGRQGADWLRQHGQRLL